MPIISEHRRLVIPAFFALLVSVAMSCASSGAEIPYAEWAGKNEFGGASDYWLRKTRELRIPNAETVPFPKFPGAKLIDFQDNRDSAEALSRMLLVTPESFVKVRDWYEEQLSSHCSYASQRKPVEKHVFARKCDPDSREKGDYDLFTTNPNVIVKEVGTDLQDFYGEFSTTIEIAYRPSD